MGLLLVSEIKGLHFGLDEVKAVYIGSEQVWPVGSLPEWIEFQDPEVLRVLLANGVGADGGITEEQAAAVTSIRTWFKGNTAIKSFNELEKFTGVKTLLESAFHGCTSLYSIDLSNIKAIEKYVFLNCSSLTGDIKIPNLEGTIRNATFQGTNIEAVSDMGKATGIMNSSNSSESPFGQIKTLKKVVFPKTLTTLGGYVFYGCTNLSNINTLENLKTISTSAFYNCTSLTIEDLSLPNLETLGQNAFYGVKIKKISNLGKLTALPAASTSTQNFGDKSVLEEVVLPETLTSIPNGSFYQYTNCVIEDLNLPNLTTLGGGAFNGTKLRRITSLGSVTQLAANSGSTGATFYNCTELTHIEQSVLDKLTFIATAFNGCSNLEIEELKLPGLEGTITAGFVGCNKIKKVTDLGNITSYFGDTALNYSTKPFGENVELIVIPKSVQSIGRYGFANFNNTLKTIIVNPTTPPQCAAYWATAMPSDTIFYVPDASVEAYKTASGWVDYADRIKPLSEYVES